MSLLIDTKPTLEWVEIGEALVAEFGLGRYEILWIGDTYIIRLNGNRIPHHYPFKDVAIAAAQADYERRTAERFRPVELPERRPAPPYESQYQLGQVSGHNRCLDRINEIIQTALDRANY